jgi:hypothetical protein
MRPRARILGIAAAWALLGSGCDFLDNLGEPHNPDRSDVVLTVKDAWTGEALPWATCSLDSLQATADAEGKVVFTGVPTGPKTLACSCEFYHARAKKVDAVPGAVGLELKLARKGSLEWYPEDPARQLRIDQVGGNYRFPGTLVIQASPGNDTTPFHYTWTSTRHGSLPSIRTLPLWTPDLQQDTVVFTLTLTVSATLADTLVEVGKSEQTIFLTRNQKPTFLLQGFDPESPVVVGTGCPEKYAKLTFSAEDPDSDSCTVRISSKGQNSPLGSFDTSMACASGILLYFPLRPHNGEPDTPLVRNGSLRVEVKDGNQGSLVKDFPVTTYSNLHPIATLDPIGDEERYLTGDSLKFRLFARDRGGTRLKHVEVDWKDGTKKAFSQTELQRRDSDSLEAYLTHAYQRAGTYYVEAMARDNCDVITRDTLPVTVWDDSSPP